MSTRSLKFDEIKRIESEIGNSFFIYDKEVFINNLISFSTAFKNYYSNIKLGHSFKTNFTPEILKDARKWGSLAEVVSGLEYKIAIDVGYDAGNIIFNGPIKEKTDLEYAIKNGSIINIDHFEELKLISTIAKSFEMRTKVGLRCNVKLTNSINRSRFGFDSYNGDLDKAVEFINNDEFLILTGVHVHTSSVRSTLSFKERSEQLVSILENQLKEMDLEYIDLGGGFVGPLTLDLKKQMSIEEDISFENYARELTMPLIKHYAGKELPTLILEPGIAVLANVFKLLIKVLALKKIGHRNIAITSGSFQTVKPTKHGINMPYTIYSNNENNEPLEWELTGYTCIEDDCFYEKFVEKINVGDYIVFDQMGAYTTVFKPQFISGAPAIIKLLNSGDYIVLRRREVFTDFLKSFNL